MYGTSLSRLPKIPLCRVWLVIFSTAFALTALRPAYAGSAPASSPPPAQSPIIPLDRAFFTTCTGSAWGSNLELSLAYTRTNWPEVQRIIRRFLKSLTCSQPFPDDAYFSVVFLNEALTPPALSRVLVHRLDPKPEIYGSRVEGYDLYDLQLLSDLNIVVTTNYQATTVPNGALTQLPGVFAKLAGAVGVVPSAIAVSAAAPVQNNAEFIDNKSVKPEFTFVVRRVQLPVDFKAAGFSTPTVVPQVSVSDQLSLTKTLEADLRKKFAERAKSEDKIFKNWNCDDVQCLKAPTSQFGPVEFVARRFAKNYDDCKNSKPPAVQCVSLDTGVINIRPSCLCRKLLCKTRLI